VSIVNPNSFSETSEPGAIAAFDLGSNSIKMSVARRAEERDVDEFMSRSETVRLGQDLESTGKLAADRIDAALDTLGRFADEARAAGATRLIGVATEATRVADNGAQFLDKVRKQTGIEIHTISGSDEAELTFRGLDGVVNLDGDVAVADIGGGSTELILAHEKSIQWSMSYSFGSGRLTDRFVKQDPPTSDEIAACRTEARRQIASAPISDVTGGRLIIVGGTGEYLDRLLPGDMLREIAALEHALRKLQSISSGPLASELSIPEARARVLPAGVAIAAGVADEMQPERFESAQSGIRRGLLLSAFAGDI
jgi:exopolyphosphatase/guanosine-5'-triphosphate,3'-diphosphate pyrophosphatase